MMLDYHRDAAALRAIECESCHWLVRIPYEQTERTMCRACEGWLATMPICVDEGWLDFRYVVTEAGMAELEDVKP